MKDKVMLLSCPCSKCEHSEVDFTTMNVYCVLSCPMFTEYGECESFIPVQGGVIDEEE